jgi:hypothetical protein
MPQQSACKFDQKHVFLVGTQDPTVLREWLANKTVRVFLHDNDEYVQDKDAQVTFAIGQA